MKINNISDLKDFIDGCTLLGVGGGGNPEEGFRALKSVLEEKGSIEWIDVNQIDDNAIAICPFLMGSTAPLSTEKIKQRDDLELTTIKNPINLMNAVQEWENYTGKKVDVVVPIEVGGSNMPVPIAVAHKLNKITVDGDYAGRAIPEIFQTSLMLEDVPFCPGVSVDKYGNIAIIKEAISIRLAERMGKYLSQVAFGSTGMAGFPVNGKQLKRLLVRGSVSTAYKIGKMLKSTRDKQTELKFEMEKIGGKLVFKGKVVLKEGKDWDGYYIGFHTIEGEDDFRDERLKIFFKNENHIAWKNEKYVVSSPDLICCIEPNLVKPMRNNEINEGTYLEVYALPCHPVLRREEVLKWLCPRYFGFDSDYVPIQAK